MMKAKTKFLKMFYKLPEKARKELVYDFPTTCFSLNVVALEVKNDTSLGRKILKKLGYVND